MYENETSKVREDIEYLRNLLENDSTEEQGANLEEVRERLDETEQDIDFLMSNLPYEVLGNIDEEREDTGDDLLEEGELEDEVVEAGRLLEEARNLLLSVREKYFGEEFVPSSEPSGFKDTGTDVTGHEKTRHKNKFRISLDLVLAIGIFVILILSCIFG